MNIIAIKEFAIGFMIAYVIISPLLIINTAEKYYQIGYHDIEAINVDKDIMPSIRLNMVNRNIVSYYDQENNTLTTDIELLPKTPVNKNTKLNLTRGRYVNNIYRKEIYTQILLNEWIDNGTLCMEVPNTDITLCKIFSYD